MESLQSKCKTCGAIFRTEDELARHSKTHNTTQSKEKSDSDHLCGCGCSDIFLPSIFGTEVSAVLINYSQPLAYLGLIIIFAFNALTAIKLIKEKKTTKPS